MTFHRIVDIQERDHDVTWRSFFRVIEAIRDVVTTDLNLSPGSGRSVVLTFDDGTVDHVEVGRVLAARGLAGIFFVPAGRVGGAGFVSESELRELHASGHAVGSHGFAHVRFDSLERRELKDELRSSVSRLEQIIDARVCYLSTPGGASHPALAEELESIGLSAARSMRWGMYRSKGDRWRIPCLPVTELTLERGWIEHALAEWDLPLTMRAVGLAKNLLPQGIRFALRARVHQVTGPH